MGDVIVMLQQVERVWMHLSGRMAAGAEALEPVAAGAIHHAFGHNAARRIAGTKKQNIVGLILNWSHDRWSFRLTWQWCRPGSAGRSFCEGRDIFFGRRCDTLSAIV